MLNIYTHVDRSSSLIPTMRYTVLAMFVQFALEADINLSWAYPDGFVVFSGVPSLQWWF